MRFLRVSGRNIKLYLGGLAQLGEHLLCKQGVVGSIPSTSTSRSREVQEESTNLSCSACRCADKFRFDLLRSLAVSFFNNLEEVKIYWYCQVANAVKRKRCEVMLMGCDCIKSKCMESMDSV